MGVVRALARQGVRRHALSLLALAATVALGLGAGLAALEAAERTESAYPDYLDRAEVGDLVVNPGLATPEIERIIRETPGVLEVASDGLLTAGPSETAEFSQVRVSEDGRYQHQDRPIVVEGRMIDHGNEAFLSTEAAEDFEVEVGDTLRLGFETAEFTGGPPPAPLGVREVEVVGTGTFADEVLPDELFPRQRILITPDVGARFDCRIRDPAPDDQRPLEELVEALIPPDCSGGNRYYSLQVEGGAAGAQAVADALAERFRAASRQLPAALREIDAGFAVIPSFTAEDADRVRESLSPAITALRAFGAIAGLATVGVSLLLAVRLERRRLGDLALWRALGVSRRVRAAAVGAPVALALAAGVVGALLLAWLASSLGPVGSASTVVPDPGRGLSAALGLPVGAAGVLLATGGVLATWSVAGAAARRERPAWRRTLRASPPVALGLQAATRGAGVGTVLATSAVALAAVTATLVFSADLADFVRTPARFGWPYDAAALTNFGYGEGDLDAVSRSLDGNPQVERWGLASVIPGFVVDGESLPVVAARPNFDALAATPVVDGRLPTGDGEVAVGSATADDLGLDIGDEVTVTTPYGERRARIAGTVVLPTVGPLESDRTSMGTGLLVPAPFFEAVLADAEEQFGMPPADLADLQTGLVTMDLAHGVDATEFFTDLEDELDAWGPAGFTVTLDEPVRPATVIDVAAMRRVPLLLAGAFALAMTAGIVAGIAAGTRSRRHELALMAALGGTRAQIRWSVRWHALVVVAVGLAIGLPVGLVAGRIGFTAFMRDLGAVPEAATPSVVLLAVAAAVTLLGAVTAEVVGRRVTRRRSVVAELLTQDTTVRA